MQQFYINVIVAAVIFSPMRDVIPSDVDNDRYYVMKWIKHAAL